MDVKLIIKNIVYTKYKYIIEWELLNDSKKIYRKKDIEIEYQFPIKNNPFFPINIVLSAFLPILTKEYGEVHVELPYKLPDDLVNYWDSYIKYLSEGTDKFKYRIHYDSLSNEVITYDDIFNEQLYNIGIYFGGGVESLFALSNLYHKNPILISIVGENWMNNDINNAKIKFQLEEELIRTYGLNIQRIKTNIRSLINRNEEYVNKYVTGPLFYFLALPVAERYRIGFLIKSSELEEALNFSDYDLSLNPRSVYKISIKSKNFPIFVALNNQFSKIQMFEELSKTPFIKYLYSCFKNTDKRWCGECSKCFRISEYCERIGLDRRVIGMQEGIVGVREKSPLARNYWIMMDKLYGRRYLREIKLALLYYLKIIKRKLSKVY